MGGAGDQGTPPNGELELFPRRLRDLRKKRGLTQGVLSELCGLESARVYRWEHCGVIPNIEAAAQLADFFGVSMDYLCGLEGQHGK